MRVVKVGIIGTGFSAIAQIEALRRIPFVQRLRRHIILVDIRKAGQTG